MGKKQVAASCRYTKSHEWITSDGASGIYRIGITDHAQDSLGDITYFGLPEVGKKYKAGEVIGFVESVKAVSDIYAPVDLEITEINTALVENPELGNRSPYGEGWIAAIKATDTIQIANLMDGESYTRYIASEQ